MPPPFGLGYEGIRYVSEIGSGVDSFSVGNAVIISFTMDEIHLHTELTTHMYASFGNGGILGGTQGMSFLCQRFPSPSRLTMIPQAEYIRVPFG
jgi:NADPH:quinone reductase-like Zn-dependent oxidoreductase